MGVHQASFLNEIIWHQLSCTTDEDRNGLASNLNPFLANYQKTTDDSKDRCRHGRVEGGGCWRSAQFLSSLQILCFALWEFKSILIFRSPFDELVWTSYIHSFRETAFKRSLDQAIKNETPFPYKKRGTDETIFTDVQDDVRVNTVYCFSWLKTPLQPFAALPLLFRKQHLQL